MPNRTAPRTPFEIRLELLELARVILQNRYEASRNIVGNTQSPPSAEEVITEAEKMNAFVSKAQSNQSH